MNEPEKLSDLTLETLVDLVQNERTGRHAMAAQIADQLRDLADQIERI